MTNARKLSSRRKAAIVACSLLAIMLADIYLLPGIQQPEIVYDGAVITKRGIDVSYVLNAKSGRRYAVPAHIYNAIEVDQRFTVKKSFLFRRSLEITFCKPHCRSYAIGTFNSSYFAEALSVLILLISLLIAFGIVKTDKWVMGAYIIFGIAFGIFVVYIIF
jgi:hypothetical protein